LRGRIIIRQNGKPQTPELSGGERSSDYESVKAFWNDLEKGTHIISIISEKV
jgi:hypothetical protein